MLFPGKPQSSVLAAFSPSAIYLLRDGNASPASPEATPEILQDEDLRENPQLCCAACLHGITTTADAITRQGQHEHYCTNPHGLEFLIACYVSANGCRNAGDWVSDFSWFSGYLWRYAFCAACHTHLGWQYRSDHDGFHGLIKVRLIAGTASH